jgi:hypothetical protein
MEIIEVKSKSRKIRTIRNTYYKGVLGKLRTICVWLVNYRDVTLTEFLDSRLTYKVELPKDIDAYHGIDSEQELTTLKEITNEKNNN